MILANTSPIPPLLSSYPLFSTLQARFSYPRLPISTIHTHLTTCASTRLSSNGLHVAPAMPGLHCVRNMTCVSYCPQPPIHFPCGRNLFLPCHRVSTRLLVPAFDCARKEILDTLMRSQCSFLVLGEVFDDSRHSLRPQSDLCESYWAQPPKQFLPCPSCISEMAHIYVPLISDCGRNVSLYFGDVRLEGLLEMDPTDKTSLRPQCLLLTS